MKAIKVLLFGGTFNPIHNGHLLIAQHVMEKLNFDKVIFIPSARPALKNIKIEFIQRITMVRMAISGNEYFEVSDIENHIDGPSYTIETIKHIRELGMFGVGEYDFHWFIGADNLEDLKSWYKIDKLVEEYFFVLGIPDNKRKYYSNMGISSKKTPDHRKWFKTLPQCKDDSFYEKMNENTTAVSIPQIDIRSTIIRDNIAKGLSIKYMVPSMVERYINNYGLYTTTQ